jgi:hypothetical protein
MVEDLKCDDTFEPLRGISHNIAEVAIQRE